MPPGSTFPTEALRRLLPHLRSLRTEVHGGRSALGRHGRIAVARIHGAHAGGRRSIVSCEKCNYAANLEKATSKLEPVEDLKPEGDGKPLEVHTPGQKTIEDVARFLGVSPKNKIKTLALMANETDAKTRQRRSCAR